MSKFSLSRSAAPGLSSLIEDDSDFENATAQNISYDDDTTMTPPAPAKKAKAAGKSKAVPASATKTTKKRGRPALKDRTNVREASDSEDDLNDAPRKEIDETMISVDDLENSVVVAPQKAKKAAAKVTKVKKVMEPETEAPVKRTKTDAPKSRKRKAVAEPEEEIQETQEDVVIDDADEAVEEPTPKPVVRKGSFSQQNASRTRQQILAGRYRAGSASDTERTSDPMLRRKVGDLTKKLESLDLKYRTLREVGIVEAEANFDKYRKQTEKTQEASKKLIEGLKKEVEEQNAEVKQSRALKKKLEEQDDEIAELKKKLAQMDKSLTNAQAENKTLTTKLAASRTAATSVQSINAKAPGSAVKPAAVRMMGSEEVAASVRIARLKEDMYSDLTGLIIRGIKNDGGDETYDCIQTGRNGSKCTTIQTRAGSTLTKIALHFKLAFSNDDEDGCDGGTCIYIPQLDHSRDRDLMELLPEYLLEEIQFARPDTAKFYSKVTGALSAKLE
jgi:hypothetical protein